ncbi:chorismate mutase [Streptantibioticus silvisoli]
MTPSTTPPAGTTTADSATPPAGPADPATPAGTATPAGPAAADTGARTDAAVGAVSADRSVIDDLDRRIIALVRERMAVSAGIQRARIASGGRRISLARETEVIGTYSGRLGRPGTALAMALLELGRGRV